MECVLEDCRIHYEAAGAGTPVLMIHGFSLDHRSMEACMEPVFSRRSEGWMRLYPDLPGMGESPAPSWQGSSDKMLQVLLSFIDEVIPGRRFLLAGDSYGGYLARGILNRRPDLVEGLLLLCPVILAPAADRDLPPLTAIVRDEGLLSRLSEEERSGFTATTVVQTEDTWARFHRSILPAVAAGNREFLEGLHGESYSFRFDVDDLRRPFLAPCLFLLGRQDSVVGYRDAWKLLVHYPRATFAILDRAGHSLEMEQEALFQALVGDWLDRTAECTWTALGRQEPRTKSRST